MTAPSPQTLQWAQSVSSAICKRFHQAYKNGLKLKATFDLQTINVYNDIIYSATYPSTLLLHPSWQPLSRVVTSTVGNFFGRPRIPSHHSTCSRRVTSAATAAVSSEPPGKGVDGHHTAPVVLVVGKHFVDDVAKRRRNVFRRHLQASDNAVRQKPTNGKVDQSRVF